jgi:hypothetical protein
MVKGERGNAMDEEGQLRQAFERLREEERRAAPSFDHVVNRRRPDRLTGRPRIGALGFAAAVALVLLLALAGPRLGRLLTPDGDTGSLAVELQATSTMWRSPTDFLLERPQARAWRGIPAIGRRVLPIVPADPAWRGRTDDSDREDPGGTRS